MACRGVRSRMRSAIFPPPPRWKEELERLWAGTLSLSPAPASNSQQLQGVGRGVWRYRMEPSPPSLGCAHSVPCPEAPPFSAWVLPLCALRTRLQWELSTKQDGVLGALPPRLEPVTPVLEWGAVVVLELSQELSPGER
ncbi:unnamed protein product [Natator depressus]